MSNSKLPDAYDVLMAFLYEAMDDTLHSVADALEIAKRKTHEMGVYTQEEINTIADYLMRDVEHVAHHPSLAEENNSLTEWLKFDIALIENFALDAFLGIADKTRIKLAELAIEAKQHHPYHSGEVAGPGTFSCNQCQKHIAFKSTSLIPNCPHCQGSSFKRC